MTERKPYLTYVSVEVIELGRSARDLDERTGTAAVTLTARSVQRAALNGGPMHLARVFG
jgi:hypothetical protein